MRGLAKRSALQIANTLSVADGGPARNAFETNLALNDLDQWSVRLLWVSGSEAESVSRDSARPLPVRPPAKVTSLRFRQLWAEFSDASVVVVHGYYLWWVPLAILLSRAGGKRVVLMPHGSLTRHQRKFSRPKKAAFDAAVGWVYKRGVSTFAVGSQREADELSEHLPGAQVAVVGVGTMVTPLQREPGWGRPLRLVSIGRIAQKKRLDISIASVRLLRESGIDAVLRIGGTGEEKLVDELRVLAAEHGVADFVEFCGAVAGEDKRALLAKSDLFLLPSDDENFGIAAAEALASGLPVIVSTDVAAAEGLPPEAGVRIERPSPQSVALAVEQLVGRNDAPHARRRASDFATERFAWEQVASRWAEVFNAVERSHTRGGEGE